MRPRVAVPTGTEMAAAGIDDVQTALQAVGRAQRNGTHHAVAQLLLNFQGGFRALSTFSAL